jgi:hypothetical protein
MIQAKEEALVGDNLIFEDTSRTREVWRVGKTIIAMDTC